VPRWRCDCGSHLNLDHDPSFASGTADGLWRFGNALGIDSGANPVTLGEGGTPLQSIHIAGRQLFAKLEYMSPTGSYKDRGASAMITQLNAWGLRHIVEDSSGNAGAAVAAYAARAGMHCDIYVPASASAGKLAQIAMFGADVHRVQGSREQTRDAAILAAEAGAFYASHNWSPFFIAANKTIAYELAEKSGWRVPDWVVVPVGGGGLLTGLHAGFEDLKRAGLTQVTPRILAVQSLHCSPIWNSIENGLPAVVDIVATPTVAEGIAVSQPVRGNEVLAAIRASNGAAVAVEEHEIWAASFELARQGIFVEPTSAAAAAGLRRAFELEMIESDVTIAIVLTGSGLKATDRYVQHLSFEDASQHAN
jgi:threonine synthase